MSVVVVKSGVTIDLGSAPVRLDVMATLLWKDDRPSAYIFLVDPSDPPEFIPLPEMGSKDDILTCPPDMIPLSDEERSVAGRTSPFSSLALAEDEIFPLTWAGGGWKVNWLIDNGIAEPTGKFHTLNGRQIPLLRLTHRIRRMLQLKSSKRFGLISAVVGLFRACVMR